MRHSTCWVKNPSSWEYPMKSGIEKKTDLLESDVYFDGDAMLIKLQKAIASLPEKQRIVFNMRYYEEMKYEKMSEILGTSVGALKASYHHAMTKIKNIINE
jgi:RNA polymerase sigma-70 factor (ECF subfamily)